MTVIPRTIRQHINRSAHAAGLALEAEERARMLAEFERLKAEGRTLAEIAEHLSPSRAGRVTAASPDRR